MVAAMNSVGVDGAIMVSSFSAYEYDPSYALEVYNTYPDKFRVVTPVDATNPAIDDVVAKWAATPGARGIRIRMRTDEIAFEFPTCQRRRGAPPKSANRVVNSP